MRLVCDLLRGFQADAGFSKGIQSSQESIVALVGTCNHSEPRSLKVYSGIVVRDGRIGMAVRAVTATLNVKIKSKDNL